MKIIAIYVCRACREKYTQTLEVPDNFSERDCMHHDMLYGLHHCQVEKVRGISDLIKTIVSKE